MAARQLVQGMTIAKPVKSRPGEEKLWDVLGYTRRGKLIMWGAENKERTTVWWTTEADLPKGYYIKEKT